MRTVFESGGIREYSGRGTLLVPTLGMIKDPPGADRTKGGNISLSLPIRPRRGIDGIPYGPIT